MDEEMLSEQVRIERKLFSLSLRENPRGRFLRITEEVGGRRDTVIVPATGLSCLRDALDRAIKMSDSKPTKVPSNPPPP